MCIYFVIFVILLAWLFYFLKYRKKFLSMLLEKEDTAKFCEKIIHAMPDMVFVFDSSLKIIRLYNPNEKELLVSSDLLIGTNVREHLNERFGQMIEESIRKTIESDGMYEMEYDIDTPRGIQYYEARFISVKKNEYACFIRNITERKTNELLLKQNQELLSSILDNIPFPIMLKDVDDDFRYIYWNKECDLQSGINRSQVIGKTDVDIYGKERGGEYQRVNQQVVDEGMGYRKQELFVTPDGKEHTSIVYKNLISNEFHRWLLVVRWNITDWALAEKNLKEANRINELVLNNTNIGLVFLNADYLVLWENISNYSSNPALAGYKVGTLCYENVYGRKDPCPGCVMKKAIASGVSEKNTITLGESIIDIMATPVYENQKELQGVVLKLEDITVKRQIALELQQAKEDAEKSDRLKSAFLANMSHEIRTPLNAILGFSELLCRADSDLEKKSYIEIIKNNSDLLLQLINDILDLSKIEADMLEFIYTDVDVNILVEELKHSFSFKIIDRPDLQINFELGLPYCVIYTERIRLMQVISNFITNAIKFTEKGEIIIGYKPCEEGICFYVKDTGIGIPKDKQQEIFNRFVKLDSFKTGTGLGLSICQTIANRLKGKIRVESELGKGSTFSLTIPCRIIEESVK